MNPEELLTTLKRQVEAEKLNRVKLQHKKETAEARIGEISQILNDEFGIDLSQVKERLLTIKAELEESFRQAQQCLVGMNNDS